MEISWKGVYPAVTTKFDYKGAIDFKAFEFNLNAQIEAGVDGIIVAGSLGESSTLSHDERIQLLKSALSVSARRVPVLLNIAEGSTESAIALVQRAENDGADGFMVLPPMMYKASDTETVDHFIAIANATTKPILLYNNPVDYKIEITIDMFKQFVSVKNIQAVKESTRDISNVTRMKNAFGDRFKILCGVDTLAMEELLMGADGWVAGLVDAFPNETVAIYRLVKSGRTDEALKIYRWFLPILELDIHPQLVQNIKLAESLTGLGNENVRLPRKPLKGKERERVLKILNEGLSNRPQLPDFKNINVLENAI